MLTPFHDFALSLAPPGCPAEPPGTSCPVSISFLEKQGDDRSDLVGQLPRLNEVIETDPQDRNATLGPAHRNIQKVVATDLLSVLIINTRGCHQPGTRLSTAHRHPPNPQP